MPTPPVAAPAVEGWFTTGPEPHLVGARCTECGTCVFPPRAGACPNPDCASVELETTELSRRGTIWSYTENRYPPPPPFPVTEPFQPYALAAVQLEAEGLVVLGQVAAGTMAADLAVGMEVEVALQSRPANPGVDDAEELIWVWRRV